MFDFQKILVLICSLLLLGLAFTCQEQVEKKEMESKVLPVSEQIASPADSTYSFANASKITRQALIPACGKCHQSTLSSHKPGAIAIFDLDKMDKWHDKLTEENLQGLDKRTKNSSSISDEEREMITAFIAEKKMMLQ